MPKTPSLKKTPSNQTKHQVCKTKNQVCNQVCQQKLNMSKETQSRKTKFCEFLHFLVYFFLAEMTNMRYGDQLDMSGLVNYSRQY